MSILGQGLCRFVIDSIVSTLLLFTEIYDGWCGVCRCYGVRVLARYFFAPKNAPGC